MAQSGARTDNELSAIHNGLMPLDESVKQFLEHHPVLDYIHKHYDGNAKFYGTVQLEFRAGVWVHGVEEKSIKPPEMK